MTSYIDLSNIKTKASASVYISSFTNCSESHRPTITSGIFSPPNDPSIQFFLRFTGRYLFTPNPITDRRLNSDNLFYSISLCLQSPIRKPLSVYFKIALLGSSGQEEIPHEGQATFYVHSDNLSTPGWQEATHGMEFKIKDLALHGHKVSRYDVQINCEVFVLDDPYAKVIQNYGTLLKSDVVLVVGEKEFNLHKIILSAQSPVFKAMFNDDDLTEENKQNRFTITDMDLKVAELIVSYIYTGEMPETSLLNQYALELYIASDKYQLEPLKAACEKTLLEALSVETAVKTLLLADTRNIAFLKKMSIEFINQNSEQVKASMGWAELIKNRPELVIELYNDLSVKASPFLKN